MDFWLLSRKDNQSTPLLATNANECLGEVSPNGRFLAYVSDESGRSEVYVQPFPDLGRKFLISTGGGEPLWSPDGRELFYTEGSTMMAVTVNTDGSFAAGRPAKLFEVSFVTDRRPFDVSEDGQRFLAVLDASSPEYKEIHVAFDWFSELEALVPAR